MNSINSFLLKLFSKEERYGQDVKSLHRRYQSLSIIYCNLGFTLLMLIYHLVELLFFTNPGKNMMAFVCVPFSLLSFFFLREKMFTLSSTMILIEMHASNWIMGLTTNCPIMLIYGILMYPFFIFSLTNSTLLHLLNASLCVWEYYHNSAALLKIFEVTLTDEQFSQIKMLIVGGLLCCMTAVSVSILQKSIESNIWKIAQENYLKSENLTKEVIQAMEAKDTFVSMLSHEIRNPLNALKGSIEYLLQVVNNHDHIKVLKNAKMSGDILLNLVNNVLDAAKLKSDKMEISCTETDFIETIKKLFTINSEKFKEKKFSVQAFIDESIPSLIWIDPSRLLQILMNLVSNAIKFTPQGGKIIIYASWCKNQDKNELLSPFENIGSDGVPEHPVQHSYFDPEPNQIKGIPRTFSLEEFNSEEASHRQKNIRSIRREQHWCSNDLSTLASSPQKSTGEYWTLQKTSSLEQSEEEPSPILSSNRNRAIGDRKGFLKIQITDTGCGISENDLPKMFGMFEQASQGARSAHGGTGLGLWICKQLCQKMKGDITVYSKPNQGSSFVFYIPVENIRMGISNNFPIVSRSSLSKEGIRALVVDDYSVNRYLHKLLLEQEGVQVSVAGDGKEALEKYKTQKDDSFDFIMMDVQMPVMDGFTSAKLIREWELEHNKRRVDIYFVTGEYFNEEEIRAGFRHRGGSSDGIRCLKKPLGVEQIHKVVKQYKRQSLGSSNSAR